MLHINEDGLLPIKSWCNHPEEGAMEQANLVDIVVRLEPIAVVKG